MAMQTAGNPGILRPEEVGPLVVEPVQRVSIGIQVSTRVTSGAKDFRLPIVTDDVSAAWTPEGSDITVTDADTDELIVTPKKLASLTKISRELRDDSSPEAAQVVGDSIARDIAKKIDQAYFANTTVNGPDGIKSIDYQLVSAGSTFDDLDAFAEAQAKAEVVGSQITAWVAHPNTLLNLQQLKIGASYNQPLLGIDPSSPTKRSIFGVPVYWSPFVDEGAVWGIPMAKAFVVMRQDVELAIDESWFFGSDSIAIRSTMRVGFGWPHERAVVKVGAGGS